MIIESSTPIVDKPKAAVQEHDQAPPSDEATMPAAQEDEIVQPQEPTEIVPFWRRPTGRGPVGKEWDTRSGTWVPLGKATGAKWVPTRHQPDNGRTALRNPQSQSGRDRGAPAARPTKAASRATTEPAQHLVRARVARGRKSEATVAQPHCASAGAIDVPL